MSDAFNGATATFASVALGSGLRGIRFTEGGGTPDVTGAEDSVKTVEGGIPDQELVIDFVGTTTVGFGDKGAIVTAWDDATSGGSIPSAICTGVNYGGVMDGEITGSATFKPSTAA